MSRSRASSVNQLSDSLGGGSSHGPLSAIPESQAGKSASFSRINYLSSKQSTDFVILKKILVAYLELNYRNSWLTPLLIVSAVLGAYFSSGNLNESNPLHKFVAVSYQSPQDPNLYGKGINDLAFVAFYTIFFTFFREFLMVYLLRPLCSLLKVKKSKITRFMEQSYSVIYYGTTGPFGLYVMYRSDDLWWFRTDSMYRDYPDTEIDFLFKVFFLGQASFWVHQAGLLVLQVEKPRKDFHELAMHHIVTLLLIWLSYVFHFTKMSLAIFITMDVSDFFFAVSKNLAYLDSVLVTPWFLIFVSSWIYGRHYINLKILWSLLTEFKTVGPYQLNFATQQYKCWISQTIIFILLGALQALNLYWLYLIFRVLYKVVLGNEPEDDRSDDEEDGGTHDDKKTE